LDVSLDKLQLFVFSYFCFCYFQLILLLTQVLATVIRTSLDKWVPATTTWRVLRLQIEKWPPMWNVAANILNKQLWTADKGWSSNLGVGQGTNISSLKSVMLQNISWCLGPGLILWYDLRNGKWT